MTSTVRPTMVLGGRYRVIERIAVGGQGEVWRAEDTALGRPVAVKVLRAEYAGSAEFRDRFRREARTAAALSHPGVAQVFDYDEGGDDTPPYLVMEYVDGESLSETIARDAPMSPDRVLGIVAAAASALAAAHAAGLVHRDVKPGNLLLGRDGSIKITDFGIARAVDAVPLTRTGTVLGTPLYLSPEQATGQGATAAGDLYALGVIAYEMLTGRPPYEGPATAVLLAHRDAPLPALPPSVPPGVRDLVLALTAKDPAMRPPGAAAVAQWADRLRTGLGRTVMDAGQATGDPRRTVLDAGPAAADPNRTMVDPVPPREGASPAGDGATRILTVPVDAPPAGTSPLRRRGLALASAGLGIAVVGAVVGWLAGSSSPDRPPARPSVAGTPSATPATATPKPVVTRRLPSVRRKPALRPRPGDDRKHKGKDGGRRHHH